MHLNQLKSEIMQNMRSVEYLYNNADWLMELHDNAYTKWNQ